jgi:hypothetical protein
MCTDTQLAKAHLLANLTLSQQARVAQSVERTTLIVWSWVRASAQCLQCEVPNTSHSYMTAHIDTTQTILKFTYTACYVHSAQAVFTLLFCSASAGKRSLIAQSHHSTYYSSVYTACSSMRYAMYC